MINLKKVEFNDYVLLQNLYNMYLNEMSIYTKNNSLDEKGYYNISALDSYFRESGYFISYLIYEDNKVKGFINLTKSPYTIKNSDFCIQDIYVLPFARKSKIATNALDKILSENKGNYFLAVNKNNYLARSFFEKMIENCKEEDLNEVMTSFSFIND